MVWPWHPLAYWWGWGGGGICFSQIKLKLVWFLIRYRVQFTKCLRLLIDEELKWSKQIENVSKLTQKNISMIKRAKSFLPQKSLKLLYNSLVLPRLDYCSVVWSNRFHSHTTKLQKIQKRAARIILNKTYDTPSAVLFTSLKWMTLDREVKEKEAKLL